MSKELDKAIEESIQRDREMHQRKQEVQEKGLILKEHQINRDLAELEKNKHEIEQAEKINFGKMTQESIEQLVEANNDYMNAAKNSMLFINSEFKKIVPYFRKNLILVGGDTGDGKSTTVANIVFSTLMRINPATGKGGRVLVLSNEEAPEDFYNRITCMLKGWAYTNHDQFTDQQRDIFSKHIPIWAKDGRLTIIGDTHQGVSGLTTTVEGIEIIFNNMLRDNDFYDAVIIDYYQNIRSSKINPQLNEYDCQRQLSGFLDQMKISYPAPIVVMAQMNRLKDEKDTTPFNIRLKGSKLICDKATFICELIPERAILRSKWKVWKSRFTEAVGECVYTGFNRGMFVPYSPEFQKNVASIVERNLEKAKKQELGLPDMEENNDPSRT